MAKYRKKIEHVEAVQVQFGKNGWPTWLEGVLQTRPANGGDFISNGDYLVRDEDGVSVLNEGEFEGEFESARAPKSGATGS